MVWLLGTVHAAALAGISWVPAGVGAISWSESEGFSGTRVGEFDGWLRPPLNFQVGWVGGKDALVGNFAAAFFRDEQMGANLSTRMVGALRPGLDYRRYLRTREAGRVNAWGDLGVYGIIPLATDRSDAYTPDEQADAKEAASGTRQRIGGGGMQLGLGAEYLLADKQGTPAIAVGARYFGRMYLGSELQEEDGFRLSTIWLTEAALYVEFFL
jgi:hypothetical protein